MRLARLGARTRAGKMCARLLGDRMEVGGRRGRVMQGVVDRLVGGWPVVGWRVGSAVLALGCSSLWLNA
eukprot:9859643-Alexandrium_andersonii.AAC.1